MIDTITQVPFRTQMRAAAIALAVGYADQEGLKLQTYPGRPTTLYTPSFFVNRIRERISYLGPMRIQRVPIVECVYLHAILDTADVTARGDAFIDGFIEYAAAHPDYANENTVLGVTETTDDPNFVPDWIPADQRKVYYATVIALEGLALV